jgi:hypothetical protein
MYKLPPELVKPGLHFRDLIAYRKATGTFKGDVEAYCATVLHNVAQGQATHNIIETGDGRAVEIVNQPMKNGGWVVTQEDIRAAAS